MHGALGRRPVAGLLPWLPGVELAGWLHGLLRCRLTAGRLHGLLRFGLTAGRLHGLLWCGLTVRALGRLRRRGLTTGLPGCLRRHGATAGPLGEWLRHGTSAGLLSRRLSGLHLWRRLTAGLHSLLLIHGLAGTKRTGSGWRLQTDEVHLFRRRTCLQRIFRLPL